MSAQPHWSPVDDATADLLTLVADEGHVSADHEWNEFVRCLHHAADEHGVISPNRLRPLVRGVVAPHRIGSFTRRALLADLIAYTGEWEVSDDTGSRNGGKPCRELRLTAPVTASPPTTSP